MNDYELKELWRIDEERAFSGWDFSSMGSRIQATPVPWHYEAIVRSHLKPAYNLLDMGTGGGEVLLTLGHPYENTSVTEAWVPNVTLCQKRLAPLGIGVYQVYDDTLPFVDNAFDIVINRHASYDLREVTRVLKPEGLFITQQVGGDNNRTLTARLRPGYPPLFPDFCLAAELPKFTSAGFEIVDSDEAVPPVQYLDVGAVVFYAKAIEWEYPDFSVDNYFPQLRALYEEWRAAGRIESQNHRFIIIACNKK